MTAADIAQRYGGRRVAGRWSIECPCGVHKRRKARAVVWDDPDNGVRIYSYSCARGAVLDGLRAAGLALEGPAVRLTAEQRAAKKAADARDIEKRRRWALEIWSQCRPGHGTLAQRYLESRAIELATWPDSLRYHPSMPHGKGPPHSSGCGSTHPALVALAVDVNGRPMAVHRTYLRSDGAGKAECGQDQKMTCGPRAGCAVRLAPAAECLLVAEGLESTASAMQLGGLPGWAALAANGIEALSLPAVVREVWIAADADDKGRGERAAHVAARRWRDEGRSVQILIPADFNDYNDVLRARRAEVNHAAA